MSISHQKINQLIESVIEANDFMISFDKEKFKEFCKQVYLIESSVSGSNNNKITDIKDKIISLSNRVKDF